MNVPSQLPRYDRRQSYEWNYRHPPQPIALETPPLAGSWDFCGMQVDSPLGVPAGPLLNGPWCLYYASLGFDVLTYKTVRSRERSCYPLPNLQPVQCQSLYGNESHLAACESMQGSWAVSYGMPSKSPEVWRADVEWTRSAMPSGKRLIVSVVGTIQDGWTIDQLADDYALCASWAIESGADGIETNFSCPNVSTCDGQLYQQPDDAARVASRVREAIGDAPYICKIGRVVSRDAAQLLIDAVGNAVDAIAMTNSIATTVEDSSGQLLFDGQRRGICGDAIRDASIEQVRMLSQLIEQRRLAIRLIGVGGASTAQHVQDYLQAGTHAVHIATAAMVKPTVALEIRKEWGGCQ